MSFFQIQQVYSRQKILVSVNRIKEELKEKGIKQIWLAEKLGKSNNMVNRYVENRKQPRLEIFIEMAEALNVDVRDVIVSNKKEGE